MGVRYKSCPLGRFAAVKDTTPHGSEYRRRYYEAKFSLSDEGIDWLDSVAGSVDGIIGVARSQLVGADFYIVVEHGVDIKSADERFYRALRRRVLNKDQVKQYTEGTALLSGGVSWDRLSDALAVSSVDTTGLVPSRYGYADG